MIFSSEYLTRIHFALFYQLELLHHILLLDINLLLSLHLLCHNFCPLLLNILQFIILEGNFHHQLLPLILLFTVIPLNVLHLKHLLHLFQICLVPSFLFPLRHDLAHFFFFLESISLKLDFLFVLLAFALLLLPLASLLLLFLESKLVFPLVGQLLLSLALDIVLFLFFCVVVLSLALDLLVGLLDRLLDRLLLLLGLPSVYFYLLSLLVLVH